MATRDTLDPADRQQKPPHSSASGSPRPEKPDPIAPPRRATPKVDSDPLAKGSVRPIPSE